jgi:hypothetical protein
MRRQKFASQPLCELCLSEGCVHLAEVVHHLTEHHGDKVRFFHVSLDDLQSLCRPHHEKLHGRTTEREWIGVDGWPLPPEQQAEREREQMARRLWENDNADDESERAM